MILVPVFLGSFASLLCFACALAIGSPFLSALLAYSVVGAITLLSTGALMVRPLLLAGTGAPWRSQTSD